MGSENMRFGDTSQNSSTELKEADLYLHLHRQIHHFSYKISSIPFRYQHSSLSGGPQNFSPYLSLRKAVQATNLLILPGSEHQVSAAVILCRCSRHLLLSK